MIQGFDINKMFENIGGDPAKVMPEVEKMMNGIDVIKNKIIEVPIIVTHYSKKEDDEVSRLLHGESNEEMEVSESVSVATINTGKISSYHRLVFDESERTVVVMDNGVDYELNTTYKEFKELLGVG